ncbi:Diadenosine tetraphosphate (Ap4A) hydrolase and other HIT family hydrolases [hydrothermal vent metagenome]|uniref:Diadenosine tetraphosphate (Ap4A) hydrolase and other HIT family hydrolases n=1 Tax=hydrothermal vent metagenome TaxID=652676 RepID=A0A3B0XS10_9ZZZZ
MPFTLHPQLQQDCYTLGALNECTLLLHKNALVPWFILVPHTQVNEVFKLEPPQQTQIQSTLNLLAHFVEKEFTTDKLNIATIGNIVPQLHVHIIGRFKNDFCWPNPVWGQADSTSYAPDDVQRISKNIAKQLEDFQPINNVA